MINNLKNNISVQKEKLIGLINTKNSWLKTVNNNSISCLQSNSLNCSVGSYELALYDSNNVKYSDISGNDFGNDRFLNSCSYSGSNCDFRYVISWSPICESVSSCINPLIRITGTLQVKPDIARFLPDTSKFDFNFIRGTISNNAYLNCESLGGTFDSATNKCSLPSSNQMCPQGQIVVGIDSNGTIICESLIDFECPVNTYAKGVNPDGTLMCFSFVGACPVDGGGNLAPPNGFNPDPTTGFSFGGGGDGCGDGGGDCN